MSISQDDLNRFHEFATQRLGDSKAEDLYELVDQWETSQLTGDQLRRNANAIQKAADDMEAGDTGRSARELLSELRNKTPSR